MSRRFHLVPALAVCCALLALALQSTAASTAPRRSLQWFATQSMPPRNLYTLDQQLRMRHPHPIRHVIRSTSPNYHTGHQDTFQILNEDTNHYFALTATIRAETPHIYMYVQNGVNFDQAALQAAAQHFEHSIYPTDRSFFGSEWRPGVDHDPHITCLIGNLRSPSAAGFYSAEDEYPHAVNPWSNQREMIYMNSVDVLPGDSDFSPILAHEFQHMIHWHMHPRDDAWLNEGMSMLAEYLNHYPPSGEPDTFLNLPTTQLDTWSLNGNSQIAHYGGAYLFLRYIYDHFGRSVIHDIVADKRYTGIELINDVLHKDHLHTTAHAIFTDWVVANWINDRSVARGRYSYTGMTSRIAPGVAQSVSVPFSLSARIPPWAAHYSAIDGLEGAKPFHLRFAAPTSVPIVSFPQRAGGWWSNRGDMINTTLTRKVNLTHVSHATLHFRTMYDIEKDYDFGYVEASLNGGKTWTTLPSTHTTRENPTGANYGNGFTGASHAWRNETVDLSRYAHHTITLRFQYITDDEYNGQGMVIKGITIPQIHFRDSGAGWDARGFIPTLSGSLPSHWTVELIADTNTGVTVSMLPVSHGTGSVTIDPGKTGLKKLTVVVFSSAPKTTVRSTYTLQATNG